MKFLTFTLFLFISVTTFSQIIETDAVDEFDGSHKINTTNEKIGKGGLSVMTSLLCLEFDGLKDTSYTVFFFFVSDRTTSIDEGDDIIVLFEDGSKVKVKHIGSYKIISEDRVGAAYFSLDRNNKNDFAEKRMKKLRISTSSKNFDFDIDEKKRDVLSNEISILSERLYKTKK